jgi:hypothetical protein
MKIRARPPRSAADQAVIDGIGKEMQSYSVIRVAKRDFTPDSLAAFIQRRIHAAAAITAAKAAWADAIREYDRIHGEVQVAVHDLKTVVVCAHGKTSPTLASFGWTLPKVTELTNEQKVAAVAKRAATRAARGTMGPKARLKVKGTVPAPEQAPEEEKG